MRRILVFAAALAACGGNAGPPITALYDLQRTTGFYAAPYPSDLLRKADGTIDLPHFPLGTGIAVSIFSGYVRRMGTSVRGFGLNTAAYVPFSGPIDESPLSGLNGPAPATSDPVLLFPLGGTAADLIPLSLRFYASALGDPYLVDNLLRVMPRPGNPLRGGTAYALVLLDGLRAKSGGAVKRDAPFDALFEGRDAAHAALLQVDRLRATLGTLGIAPARVVSATVFTTQDVDGEMAAIRSKAEASLTDDDLTVTRFQEVTRLDYTMGTTSVHGKPAAILTVTYADGSTDVTELDPETAYPPALDLAAFPFRVFEGRLRTVSLQGVADKPFGSPGLGLIGDANLDTGQIRFARGADGTLSVTSAAEPEEMRITIQVPVDAQRRPLLHAPVMVFDHGTGGSAYNAILSPDGKNRSADLTAAWAAHPVVIVSRDQPLFGQRYPIIDQGYNIYLVAYNVAKITAFRDNLRQSAVDNLVLQRFVERKMNDLFVAQGIAGGPIADGARFVRFGHSLGSVSTHLGTAFLSGTYQATLASGSGGLFALFFLDSGLLPRLAGDPANLGILLMALNIDPNAPLTTEELIGGLAGIPRGPGRAAIDLGHPTLMLAQTLLDPADPLSYARRLTLPITIVRGTGDEQVPNSATDALANALPNVTVKHCEPTSDYDPHQCTFREDAGLAAVRAWADAVLR
jgi:hypothetical protein